MVAFPCVSLFTSAGIYTAEDVTAWSVHLIVIQAYGARLSLLQTAGRNNMEGRGCGR
jgi:hypothetical protein